MRTTEERLKQIIKEEVTKYITELRMDTPAEMRMSATQSREVAAAEKEEEDKEAREARRDAWKQAREAARRAKGHVVTTATGEPISVPTDPRFTGSSKERAAAWRKHIASDKQTDIMPDEPRSSVHDQQWGAYGGKGQEHTVGGLYPVDQQLADKKREKGRGGAGALYSTDELSDMQFAGEMATIPAEFLKGVAGMTPASAALAATEAAAVAADSPYALRPGRSEFYRSYAEAPEIQFLRSVRLERKKVPLGQGVNSEEELKLAYLQMRPYIKKDRKGNIHIRAAGDKMGAAYDPAVWSADLGREIRDSFFDVRKRLIKVRQMKKKKGTKKRRQRVAKR